MRYIDLHTHSTHSDGTCAPGEVLDMAVREGLAAVALTDHDTVSGLPEFLARAAAHDSIIAVPGVEISSTFMGREVHFVGLFINPEHAGLKAFLREIIAGRDQRNRQLAARLNTLGYPVDIELKSVANVSVGRPHFARELYRKYDFDSLQDIFDKLLRRGKPGYVPRKLPNPQETIDIIHAAGGIAIWAHPVYRQKKERSWCQRVLKILAPAGLDGIEAYYTGFDEYQNQVVLEMAEIYGLAVSGGSDFHGENHPETRLGWGKGNLKVPEDLLSVLSRRAESCILNAK